MPDLWIFTGLTLIAATALAVGRLQLRASWRVGMGGPDEDLEKARRLYRLVLLSAVTCAIAAGFALVLGLHGASAWRQTGGGQAVLNTLLIVAAIGFIRSFAKAVHQQWSSRGSFLGVVRETSLVFLAGGLVMLAMYFRWGA